MSKTYLSRSIVILLMLFVYSASVFASEGEVVYNKYCSACHGEQGDANTAASNALNPKPRNFTEADFERHLTRDRIIEVVTHGSPGTAMVGWQRRLSRQQIEAVADYLRQRFAKQQSTGPSEPCASCHESEPASNLGEQVYQSRCYFCHGYDGAANTEAAKYLSPPPKALKYATLDIKQIVNAVRYGRAKTAMMAFSDVLSEQEILAVADYIVSQIQQQGVSQRYHSDNNGWPEQFRQAWSSLSEDGGLQDVPIQLLEKRGCLSCHQPATDSINPRLVER